MVEKKRHIMVDDETHSRLMSRKFEKKERTVCDLIKKEMKL
jgi:hypothetical protein